MELPYLCNWVRASGALCVWVDSANRQKNAARETRLGVE